MKKIGAFAFIFLFTCTIFCNRCMANEKFLSVKELNNMGIITASRLSKSELERAKKIILDLQKENSDQIKKGYGPFLAAIYEEKGNLIAKMPNTVVKDKCCLNHAEINTIREADKKLETYNLSPYHLSLYVTAEPCIMCMGGIMWSGIDKVYYSVSSKDVENITGFDEGYKPNWINAFKKRNIKVYGNIESDSGKEVLKQYVNSKNTIYKPNRK